MKRLLFFLSCFVVLVGCFIGSLALFSSYRDSQLRQNIHRVKVGMSEDEVIQILGKPTARAISDIPGTYWHYRTDLVYQLIDDNPDSVGYLVLEMGSNGKVIKVFDLK